MLAGWKCPRGGWDNGINGTWDMVEWACVPRRTIIHQGHPLRLLHKEKNFILFKPLHLSCICYLPGATMGDPTHDKGHAERTWQAKAEQDSEGLPGSARASTPKLKSVCLLFIILCLSPTLLTFTGGYPRPPFSEENQLRALVTKSPGLERSIFTLTPLLLF